MPAAVLVVLAVSVALAVVLAGGDEPPTATIPAGNLTTNPSFERDTSGWEPNRADIEREPAADAPDGEYVARVALTGSPASYAIDDDQDSLGSSIEGHAYTAVAWVKATEATNGEQVCIGLREDDPTTGDAGEGYASITLSSGEYRELRVTYTATASSNTIGVHVFRDAPGVQGGEAFLVDAISVTEVTGTSEPSTCG